VHPIPLHERKFFDTTLVLLLPLFPQIQSFTLKLIKGFAADLVGFTRSPEIASFNQLPHHTTLLALVMLKIEGRNSPFLVTRLLTNVIVKQNLTNTLLKNHWNSLVFRYCWGIAEG
jgi:hypothetical protein